MTSLDVQSIVRGLRVEELSFLDPVRDDLAEMEALLRERLPGQHQAVRSAIDHLLGSGGKRLRPGLLLLSSRGCGAEPRSAIFAAAAVEMLHTATLVHDDLIDSSPVRRGSQTLNSKWPAGVTVLTGDYLFALSSRLISQAGCLPLVERYSDTLMTICNGEISQWFDGKSAKVSRNDYDQRILEKTASLTAFCSEGGALLGHADDETRRALRTYGEQLGMAYQIMDDVLDYTAVEQVLGKPVGSDLQQGLVTLPLVLFLEQQPESVPVRRILDGDRSPAAVHDATRAVAQSTAVRGAVEIAIGHAVCAKRELAPLPDSPYRQGLLELADFVVSRRF